MHFYENRGYAAASSPPAEPADLDLPEAAPWTGNWWHLIATWLFGTLIFAGLVTFIMHFGAIEVFAAKLRGANPLAAALACQLATYVSAAAVWFRVLKRAGSLLPFLSLLRLAFVELFANQAVPTGGLSGSFMVIRCLMRRGLMRAAPVPCVARPPARKFACCQTPRSSD